MKTDITLIFVTYNSEKVISQLLNNFVDHQQEFKFIVVDNNSSDDIENLMSEKYPFVDFRKQEKNLGFGRANNVGLELVDTKYAMLLNPDVDAKAEEIKQLAGCFTKFDNAMVLAPATEDYQYKQSDAGEVIHTPVPWVVGAAMMFDMKKLRKVGFFDESFFLYYEETDLCKRILDQSYQIILIDSIMCQHNAGTSSAPNKRIDYLKGWHLAWSKMYFHEKYSSKVSVFRKNLSFLLKFLMKYVFYKIIFNKKKSFKYKARCAGGWAYFVGKKAFDENGKPRGFPS